MLHHICTSLILGDPGCDTKSVMNNYSVHGYFKMKGSKINLELVQAANNKDGPLLSSHMWLTYLYHCFAIKGICYPELTDVLAVVMLSYDKHSSRHRH